MIISPPKCLYALGVIFLINLTMRRILLLAVILTAILPLCAQDNKLTGLRHTLTEHYSADAEKQRATPLWTKFATGRDTDNWGHSCMRIIWLIHGNSCLLLTRMPINYSMNFRELRGRGRPRPRPRKAFWFSAGPV